MNIPKNAYLCLVQRRTGKMYIEFDRDYLRELFEKGQSSDKKHRYQPEVVTSYRRCVRYLKNAERVEELFVFNSLHYEVLSGDKADISSVRINRKYRLEFTVREVAGGEQIITVCRLLEISNHYQ